MADLRSGFNVLWSFANGPPTYYLTSTVVAAGIALFTLLLAAQLLIQATASRFIGIDMAVNRLMANADLIGYLLGTPLLT